MRHRLIALLVVALLSGVGAATSARGSKPGAAAVRAPRIPALPRKDVTAANLCPIPAAFRQAFVRAARDTGFQLSMLVAVAEEESRFQPDARSSADARGLLQVMPTTAASLNLNVDDPASNILAGARYLKLLLDRYQSTDAALAAYNAGPTAVDRAGGVAPSVMTLTYVANVQARWRALAGCR
jgi:soluble lytic murein transglycosylase-like protein